MIVEFLKDIFEPQIDERAIDRLWFSIENRHQLLIRNDEDIDALIESEWYKTQRSTTQEIIYQYMIWSMQNTQLFPNVVVSTNNNGDRFGVEEAERYLRQVFFIVLENSNNDAYFFNALLRCFKNQGGNKITKQKNEEWLEYRLGGGTTVRDVIQTKLDAYTHETFIKAPHRYLRCFVILDSDKKYADMLLSNEKDNTITYLNNQGVPYHILEKREIENYLPDETIDSITTDRAYIDAYLNLTAPQKDFFDLEKGFDRTRNFNDLQAEIRALYNNVSQEDKNVLRNQNLSQKYRDLNSTFKAEFPKLFNHETVTRESLLARCGHSETPNELPNLIKRIADLL